MSDSAGIYFGGSLRAEIPPVDLTSFTLGRASELGDKPALVDGASGRSMTYAELERSVRSLAAGLSGRGVAKGDTFALFLPNLPEYPVVFHGVLAAGGRCTTINPTITAGELAVQLADAGARAVVTIPALVDVARQAVDASGRCEVVSLGEGDGATRLSDLLGDPSAAPAVDFDVARDIAALPYSSGTTGLGKGVMLSHRNLVTNLLQVESVLPLGDDDVLIAALPFFHVLGQTCMMNHGLRAGATIVTMPRFDLAQFLALIERYHVTQACIVPPIALALCRHPAVKEHDLSSLRYIVSGAAPLGAEVATELARRVGCEVSQGYGMTETSGVTHFDPPFDRHKPGSIGPPIPGTECRLVDPMSGCDAVPGQPGELWVRGPQLMVGYLNNPAATAATVDQAGWLHTGDVAVADEEGRFYIVDRLKELIKYKGFQVAPAELEAVLLSHPAVADCAVIGVPDDEAGEVPKAFVVRESEDLDAGAVIDFVAQQVAPYKRVRQVEFVGAIPKSASGKVLKRLLRSPAAV